MNRAQKSDKSTRTRGFLRKATVGAAALALTAVGGLAASSQASAAGACQGGSLYQGYTSNYSYFTHYVPECDWMRTRPAYHQPGIGYTWGPFYYDYTVGDAYSDYTVRNYPQYTPVVNSEGSDYIA